MGGPAVVMLYVGGQYVGKLPDDAATIAQHMTRGRPIEVRDEAGGRIGHYVPDVVAPPDPLDLPLEELERRRAGEFVSYEEMKKRLGWE